MRPGIKKAIRKAGPRKAEPSWDRRLFSVCENKPSWDRCTIGSQLPSEVMTAGCRASGCSARSTARPDPRRRA